MFLSKTVAQRVREILAERNMTQAQLERLSTIHHGTMNDFLKGEYKTPSMKTVYLIIKALDMKMHEFFNSPLFDNENIEVD